MWWITVPALIVIFTFWLVYNDSVEVSWRVNAFWESVMLALIIITILWR